MRGVGESTAGASVRQEIPTSWTAEMTLCYIEGRRVLQKVGWLERSLYYRQHVGEPVLHLNVVQTNTRRNFSFDATITDAGRSCKPAGR